MAISNINQKEAEFEKLLADYGGVIWRVCLTYADSREEAADMRQDCLVNLWRGRESFRGESGLSTWIHRVCLNTCISFMRREKPRKGGAIDAEPLPDLPADEADKAEMTRRMYELIKRLKTRERAVILLWLEDFSYDEIADVMGVNRNSIATLLRRVKQKLADMAAE